MKAAGYSINGDISLDNAHTNVLYCHNPELNRVEQNWTINVGSAII